MNTAFSRILCKCFNQRRLPSSVSCRHYARSWKKTIEKDHIINETVFQYAGKNTQRADRVYVWGYAATGALGVKHFMRPEKRRSPRSTQLSPYRHMFWDENRIKVYDVGCGYGFTVFLIKEGDRHLVYGTGINTDSQLGYQEYPPNTGRILDFLIRPARIDLPLIDPVKSRPLQVKCGRAHTLILTDEGVFSLGNNASGQCGRHIVEGEIFHGSQIINKLHVQENITQLECGQDHSLFLTDDGRLLSCGLGADGQTGVGHYRAVERPTLIEGDIKGENITHMSSRGDCVLVCSEKGDVFGWGNSEYDQLSVVAGDKTQVEVPRHLPFKDVGKVVKVAAAGSMCALLNDVGQVFVWGYGILGKGPNVEQSNMPTLLPETLFGRNEFNTNSKVVDILCGVNHFLAVTNHGDLFVWGRNQFGCLGLGHKKHQYFPIKASVPAEIRHVATGVDHVVALCKAFG